MNKSPALKIRPVNFDQLLATWGTHDPKWYLAGARGSVLPRTWKQG